MNNCTELIDRFVEPIWDFEWPYIPPLVLHDSPFRDAIEQANAIIFKSFGYPSHLLKEESK